MGTSDLMTPEWEMEMRGINGEGWDMYFCINQPKPDFVGVKPSDAEIQSYDRFILDFDPLPGEASVPYLSPGNIRYAAWWTWVVYSGRGMQLHCKLAPHNLSVADMRARVRSIFKSILSSAAADMRCHLDTSTTDASRLVRMPGTVNWRTGERARAATHGGGLSYVDWRRYEPDPTPEPPPPLNTEITHLSQVAPRLTRTAINYLTFGVTQDRHKTCFAAAISLREAGVLEEQAVEWCWKANNLVIEPLRLSARDIQYCVKSAYQKQS